MSFSYAVVHDDPPQVFVAENMDVLHHVLALRVVAQTPGMTLGASLRDRLRKAVLQERWGDALSAWIDHTGIPVDVYPDGLELWTASRLAEPELRPAELEFTPLFRE